MSKSNLQMRDYNFFSSSIGISRNSKKKFAIYIALIVLYAMFTAGGYIILQVVTNTGKDQIKVYNDFLQSEDTLEKTQLVQEKKQDIERLKVYAQSLEVFTKQLQSTDTINSEYIQQITSTIPEELFFENISMTYNQLQIQGGAPNRIKIAELLNNMQELGLFEDVYISSIGAASTGTETGIGEAFTFTMSCQLKEVIAE